MVTGRAVNRRCTGKEQTCANVNSCLLAAGPHNQDIMSAYSKLFEKIRIRPAKEAEAPDSTPLCQWDGCTKKGPHRAPVGRMREGEYFHFCLEHVRLYNKSFNYFSGVPDSEVARFQKEALTGHRPTWRMGGNGAGKAAAEFADVRSGSATYYRRVRDPFGFFSERKEEPQQPRVRKLRTLETRALDTLGLDANATAEDIRTRYKLLVKQHHPDANGGDRASEARFSAVLEAYRLLRQAGLC